MKLQSLGPGRERRICNGCGSKAWGDVMGVGGGGVREDKTLKKQQELKVLNCFQFLNS